MGKKEPEVKKVVNLIPVRVIINDNTSTLVEYMDKNIPIRATVAAGNVIGNKVKETVLAKAVKHGIDWSELSYPKISPNEIHLQLRMHGIWTAQDARSKPGQVKAAILQATAPLVSTIFEFIKNK
jgi:hypothetical protein